MENRIRYSICIKSDSVGMLGHLPLLKRILTPVRYSHGGEAVDFRMRCDCRMKGMKVGNVMLLRDQARLSVHRVCLRAADLTRRRPGISYSSSLKASATDMRRILLPKLNPERVHSRT